MTLMHHDTAEAAPVHHLITKLSAQLETAGWVALAEQTLVSEISSFAPRPELAVTTAEAIRNHRSPLPADRVDLAVEVVSSDRGSDYIKRRMWYAMSDIPLYLLIDPLAGLIELYSQPESLLTYRQTDLYRFGEPVELPEPFFLSLDTT